MQFLRTPASRAIAALACALACPAPARAAITYVQQVRLTSGTEQDQFEVTSDPFTTPPASGSTIIVLAWAYGLGVGAELSVRDSAGNTYAPDVQKTVDNGTGNSFWSAAIFSAPVKAQADGGFTVTVSMPDSGSNPELEAVAMEYSGVGSVDRTGVGWADSGMPTVRTDQATRSGTELVEALTCLFLSGDPFRLDAGPDFAERAIQTNNASHQAGQGVDRIVDAAGVQTATWTVTPNPGGYLSVIATYFEADAGFGPDSLEYRAQTCGCAQTGWSVPVLLTLLLALGPARRR